MKTVGNYIHNRVGITNRGDSIAFAAYKYTMRAMFQARPTPMETTNTAGSTFPTIPSLLGLGLAFPTLDALLHFYCVFGPLGQPDFVQNRRLVCLYD